MSYVDYMVKRITDEIDEGLLSRAFVSRNPSSMMTLEDRIYQEVVLDRLFVDLNLLGGQEVHIYLGDVPAKRTDYSYIFRIGADKLNGKRVLSALSVDVPVSPSKNGGMKGALLGPYSTGTTNIRLCGINTVEVNDVISHANLFLRCRIGDEPNFANWDARSIPEVGDFAVLAAKMIIYTRLNTELGDGTNNSGSINQYLRSALDEMADAATMYRDARRERMRKLVIFKDPVAKRRATSAVTQSLF